MKAFFTGTISSAIGIRPWRRRIFALLLLVCSIGLALPPELNAEPIKCNYKDPINALWLLAQSCKGDKGCYSACGRSNSDGQYVIIKDFRWKKNHAYLIIPSQEMKGIESPEIFNEPFVNLWKYGWDVGKECPGQPPAHTGLAINSRCARTEDQLHIHISCIRYEVQRCLDEKDKSGEISSQPAHPSQIILGPNCNPYDVVKIGSLGGKSSPFNIIQHFPGINDKNMDEQSIAVVGSDATGKYYLLNTYHHGPDIGGAEELLNQDCSDWLQPHPAPATACHCK